MAHPDKKRQGSEKAQREHSGPTTERSDAGLQTHSRGARGKGPTPSDGDLAPHGADRAAGTAPDPSDASEGEARELGGRGAMADRGLERSGEKPAGTQGPKAPHPKKSDAGRRSR